MQIESNKCGLRAFKFLILYNNINRLLRFIAFYYVRTALNKFIQRILNIRAFASKRWKRGLCLAFFKFYRSEISLQIYRNRLNVFLKRSACLLVNHQLHKLSQVSNKLPNYSKKWSQTSHILGECNTHIDFGTSEVSNTKWSLKSIIFSPYNMWYEDVCCHIGLKINW